MTDVFLFRHSHVDYRPPAEITAHNPLTPLGHRLAALLAARCDDWDLQHLFVSTMPRAQQTADAISARFPGLPRLDMPEFCESNVDDLADFEGPQPPENMNAWEEAHFIHANLRTWERVARGWEKMQATIAEQGLERVAVVSHGGAINIMVRLFLGQEEVTRLRRAWFEIDWTATTCLRYGGQYAGATRAVRWINDARHIDPLRAELAAWEARE
jgi:broad specificity phosphatase PhoE